jgi:hypothetical protein
VAEVAGTVGAAADTEDIAPAAARIGVDTAANIAADRGIAAAGLPFLAEEDRTAAPAYSKAAAHRAPYRVARWLEAATVRQPEKAAPCPSRRNPDIRYTKGALHAHIGDKSTRTSSFYNTARGGWGEGVRRRTVGSRKERWFIPASMQTTGQSWQLAARGSRLLQFRQQATPAQQTRTWECSTGLRHRE